MSLFSKRFHNFCSGGVSWSKFRFCLPKSLFAMCNNGSRSVSLIKEMSSFVLIKFWLFVTEWSLFSLIKLFLARRAFWILINSFELNSWKGKTSFSLEWEFWLKWWHCWWMLFDAWMSFCAWLSTSCCPHWSLHFAHIDCLLISQDWRSLMNCFAKLGSNNRGLSEHSCSHSHMVQCFLERSHKTLMASWAAFLWSSNFFIARVIGPEILGSALKSNVSGTISLSFWDSLLSEKNFLRRITLSTLDFPLGSKILALVSLISVILAGPDHFGVNFGFLPSGAKSSYQTRSSMLNECGRACLSKLSLETSWLDLATFFAMNLIFCRSWYRSAEVDSP